MVPPTTRGSAGGPPPAMRPLPLAAALWAPGSRRLPELRRDGSCGYWDGLLADALGQVGGSGQVEILVGLEHQALDLRTLVLLMLGHRTELYRHRCTNRHLRMPAHNEEKESAPPKLPFAGLKKDIASSELKPEAHML